MGVSDLPLLEVCGYGSCSERRQEMELTVWSHHSMAFCTFQAASWVSSRTRGDNRARSEGGKSGRLRSILPMCCGWYWQMRNLLSAAALPSGVLGPVDRPP